LFAIEHFNNKERISIAEWWLDFEKLVGSNHFAAIFHPRPAVRARYILDTVNQSQPPTNLQILQQTLLNNQKQTLHNQQTNTNLGNQSMTNTSTQTLRNNQRQSLHSQQTNTNLVNQSTTNTSTQTLQENQRTN
jgi:hypothetical protein